jgi:RNA polymerase sigma factor (sigma-70 family)
MSEEGAGSGAEWGAVGSRAVAELYCDLSKRLEQIVRLDVRAPDPLIEDACQFAWSRLVSHCDRVRRDTALAWLVRTAVREAIRLSRLDRRELSLEATLENAGESLLRLHAPTPDELLSQRERLAQTRRLPERQQRLLWLHALGLSYAEMAVHEGYTRRTVERQLLRAKRRIRHDAATHER